MLTKNRLLLILSPWSEESEIKKKKKTDENLTRFGALEAPLMASM